MKKTTINHISNDLDEENVKELLAYLQTYKRKCWAYNEKYKKLKKIKIIGNSITIICAGCCRRCFNYITNCARNCYIFISNTSLYES